MARLIKNNIKLDIAKNQPITSGGGGWPLRRDHVENFAWVLNIFSQEEIDAICNIGKSINLEKGSTFGKNDDSIRNSYVSFIFPNQNTSWIFHKLTDVINNMNNQFFGFDLSAMEQGLQFTQYSAPGEHYEWHIDRGLEVGVRKLSLSLQLSDPDEYEGGDLEMWFGGDPVKASRQKGMITIFPSYVMHRVTPVTKGTRKSLVCWISGPPFK
jgi:PKHD-type hydroxylase